LCEPRSPLNRGACASAPAWREDGPSEPSIENHELDPNATRFTLRQA
jgi:hypothetical protein